MSKIIDGKKISLELSDLLKNKISLLKDNGKDIVLSIIQVGSDPAATIYNNSKIKKCAEFGITTKEYNFDENATTDEIVSLIHRLNNDDEITGIFIEMPLPNHLDKKMIINEISYKKDIEGITDKNLGNIYNDNNGILPATANSVYNLLKNENINLNGKNVVIMGRSNIVGKPLALMMLNDNATVTVCHSKTTDIKDITNKADILIVAVNKEKYVDSSFIKDNAIVIDVGIHRNTVDGKNMITGDVDYDSVKDKASYITPVPGGVGPLTVVMLINNLVLAKEIYG